MSSSATTASRRPVDFGRAWEAVLLAPGVRARLLELAPGQRLRYEQADFFGAVGLKGCVLVYTALGLLVMDLVGFGFKFAEDLIADPDGTLIWQKLHS